MSLPAFIGREKETGTLRKAIRSRKAMLVSGVSGIGKTALIENTIRDYPRIYRVSGRWMTEWLDAVAYFSEIIEHKPRSPTRGAVALWLQKSLCSLPCDIFFLDDFEYLDPDFGNILLSVLRTADFPFAVLAASASGDVEFRQSVSDKLVHLHLQELSARDLALYCKCNNTRPEELPRQVRGHPQLMQIYLENGSTGVEEWVDTKLMSFSTNALMLLKRLCLAQTSLQERWAGEGFSRASHREIRNKLPSESSLQRVKEHLLIGMNEARDEKRELESGMLDFLLARPELSRQDFHRAVKIALDQRAQGLRELVAKFASSSDAFDHHSLVLLQPALNELMLSREIPAESRLLWFRSMGEDFDPEQYLKIHDRLIDSEDNIERAIAKVNYLRACYRAGVDRMPRMDRYIRELAAEDIPSSIREQALCLWATTSYHRSGFEKRKESVYRFLEKNGMKPEVVEAFRVLFGGRSGWAREYQGEDLRAQVLKSHRIFARNNLQGMADVCIRNLVMLSYVENDDETYLDTCNELQSHGTGYGILDTLFPAVIQWTRCNFEPMENIFREIPDSPYYNSHPLLRGPYYKDIMPYVMAVLRDLTFDASPNPDYIPVLEKANRHFYHFYMITNSAGRLAQHFLFRDNTTDSKRLIDLLRNGKWPQERYIGELLREYYSLYSGEKKATIGDMIRLARVPLHAPERITLPYYVLLSTRTILRHGIPGADFVGLLSSHPGVKSLFGLSRWIVDECCDAMLDVLGMDLPERENNIDVPPGIRETVRNLIWRNIDRPKGRPVKAYRTDTVPSLKRHLDQNWREPFKLEAFAEANGISTKHLTTHFTRAYGISPKKYQGLKRLEEARSRLIKEPDRNITEIALACGFHDSADFSRKFKMRYGVSPRDYRKSVDEV